MHTDKYERLMALRAAARAERRVAPEGTFEEDAPFEPVHFDYRYCLLGHRFTPLQTTRLLQMPLHTPATGINRKVACDSACCFQIPARVFHPECLFTDTGCARGSPMRLYYGSRCSREATRVLWLGRKIRVSAIRGRLFALYLVPLWSSSRMKRTSSLI